MSIPGVTLPSHPAEKVVAGTDTTIVDGVDTTTGEIVNFDAAGGADETATTTVESGLVIGEHDDEDTRYPVCRMPFRKRMIAQLTADPEINEQRYHLTRAEHTEISAIEMDADNSYVQNLILATKQYEELKKYDVKDTHFEPGRYENVPNEVYHAANGISSTQLKDARISLMYYHGRHVTKVIPRQQSDAFTFGNVTHSYVLEPEKFSDEFAVPAEMPEGVVSSSSDMVAIIKEYNSSLPALMTPDEIKAWIEAYNNDLIPPLSLSGSAEEIGMLYMSLPEEFQRLPADTQQTAKQQKGCIKEYNASLPPMLKTSGTRDQLLDQIATVAPDMAAAERAKFVPYNVTVSIRFDRKYQDLSNRRFMYRTREDMEQDKALLSRFAELIELLYEELRYGRINDMDRLADVISVSEIDSIRNRILQRWSHAFENGDAM